MLARAFVRSASKTAPLARARSLAPLNVSPVRMHHCNFPAVGSVAPDFTAEALIGKEFKKIKLSDYRGKWVVLFFYPLDFTFVCPTEIIAFSNMAEEFRKNNCEVLGCSVDSKFTHLAWVETPQKAGGLGKCNVPLISDLNREIGQLYGVMHKDSGHHLRGTYVIDPQGVVRAFSMYEPPIGRNVEEFLRIVQAGQFFDKNGEVCPAGWRPGQDTIVGDPTKKLAYFSKHGKDE